MPPFFLPLLLPHSDLPFARRVLQLDEARVILFVDLVSGEGGVKRGRGCEPQTDEISAEVGVVQDPPVDVHDGGDGIAADVQGAEPDLSLGPCQRLFRADHGLFLLPGIDAD